MNDFDYLSDWYEYGDFPGITTLQLVQNIKMGGQCHAWTCPGGRGHQVMLNEMMVISNTVNYIMAGHAFVVAKEVFHHRNGNN